MSVIGFRRIPVLLTAMLMASAATAQTSGRLLPLGFLIAEQSRPSFSLVGAGARSAGMGGAFTALADDAAAASFNPAGLALLIKPEISLVGSGARRGDKRTGFGFVEPNKFEAYSDTSTAFSSAGLNFAAFTVPFTVARRNLCVQFSYHRLIDFTYDVDRTITETVNGGPVEEVYRQRVTQDGDIDTVSIALAYELTQRLSLGVSVARWAGDWRFVSFDSQRSMVLPDVQSIEYTQDNHLRGWNWNAGMLLRYRYMNVGAMYRTAFDPSFRVDSNLVTNIPSSIVELPVDGRLHWPASWTLGLAIKPTDIFHVTVDYTHFKWSEMSFDGIKTQPNQRINFFDLRPAEDTRTPDAGEWRFGSELTVFAGQTPVSLRAGYFEQPQPQLLPADNRQIRFTGFSAGVGVAVGHFNVDLAYQRSRGSAVVGGFFDPRAIATGELQSQATGVLTTTEQRVYLGVLYRFASGQGIHDLLHSLFIGPVTDEGPGKS